MGIGEERLKRLIEIKGWLLELGMCQMCSMRYSLEQVEREMGDRNWTGSPYSCKRRDRRGFTCLELKNAVWLELPEATLWARVADRIREAFGGASLSANPSPHGNSSARSTFSPRGQSVSGARRSG